MLGIAEGSVDIDGVDEGLIDGPILSVSVGGSLEFSLGESDTVSSKLPLKDGLIDADGIPLIFVVGEILTLGPMLGLETGSNDLDGCNEGLLDGLVLSVGPSLGFSLGKADSVGGALALNDGCIDTSGTLVGFIDGVVVVLTDGSVLTSVGLTLGFSVGKWETDGSVLTLGR
jgi:hypothetical protein